MKNLTKLFGIIAIGVIIGLSLVGCGDNDDSSNPGGNNNGGDIEVRLSSVWANGSTRETTTDLTLEFSDVIQGLSTNDITLIGVSGVVKGTLGGSGPTYTLPISGFSSSGTLSVAVLKSGYTVNSSPSTVNIFYYSVGGGNSGLVANWHNSEADADAPYYQTPLYEFTADGDFYYNGYTGNYVYSATNSTVTILDIFGDVIGTADYSISGTKLTLSNVTGNVLTAGDYYKKAEYVSFSSVSADGSSSLTTTQLTLTFGKEISGLTADDITLSNVSGVVKGTLSGSGLTYTLPISGFSSGGTLSVAVAKPGYNINGSPRTVSIFCVGEVTFTGLTANGSSTQTTTQLTLTFSQAITGLTASDITLSGMTVNKGTLSGSGPTYTLGISGVTTDGTLSVAVAKSGYIISDSSKTVTVYYYYVPQAAPSTPTGVSASAQSSSSIRVQWNSVSGATSYRVAIANATQASVGLWSFDDQTTETSITYNGLNASQTYYFKVKAYNGSLSSPETSTVSATTQSSGSGGTAPSTPTGVTATTNSSSSITVSWSSVSNATGYYIYCSSTASGTYTQVGTSTSTSYQNTGLSASTTYYYKVAAYNSNGTGSQSSYTSTMTQSSSSGPAAPKQPSSFLAARVTAESVVRMVILYPLSDKATVDTYTYTYYLNGNAVFTYTNAPNRQTDSYGTYGETYTSTADNTYAVRIADPRLYSGTSGTYTVRVRITSGGQYIDTVNRTVTIP
jgi:fibronectin type 3 domain-containing protein